MHQLYSSNWKLIHVNSNLRLKYIRAPNFQTHITEYNGFLCLHLFFGYWDRKLRSFGREFESNSWWWVLLEKWRFEHVYFSISQGPISLGSDTIVIPLIRYCRLIPCILHHWSLRIEATDMWCLCKLVSREGENVVNYSILDRFKTTAFILQFDSLHNIEDL